MTVNIELSEDAFALLFRPINNPLNPNASFDWGSGFGTLFETYGDEFAYVQQTEPERVWTLLSGDDGDVISNGFWRVNRLGYFITEVSVPPEVDIQVELESVDDDEQPL